MEIHFVRDELSSSVYSLAHPGLFYTGKIGLAHCHTLSCAALQPTVQPNQIAERLIRHLTPYMNQSDLQTVVQPVYFRE